MNIFTLDFGNGPEVCLGKGKTIYQFVDREHKPENTIDLIRNYSHYLEQDLAEIPRKYSYLPPLVPGQMFLPARNFRSHSEESGTQPPENPYFFMKTAGALVPHHGSAILPRGVTRLDYEGEIGIIIGKRGKYISAGEAGDYIFGYTVLDDVSIRDFQTQSQKGYGMDWVLGKNGDGCMPIGPHIVPKEDAGEFRFTIETFVNEKLKQHGSTDDMIFSPEQLIARLSNTITLWEGDLVSTGTPAGVAEYSSKEYLKPGDSIEISVRGIGTLKHSIVADQ